MHVDIPANPIREKAVFRALGVDALHSAAFAANFVSN